MEGNLGQKESYAYDAQGNLISVTDAMGNTTKRECVRNGNWWSHRWGGGRNPVFFCVPGTAVSESAWEEQTSVLMKGTMQGTSWPRQMPLDGALIMAMTF